MLMTEVRSEAAGLCVPAELRTERRPVESRDVRIYRFPTPTVSIYVCAERTRTRDMCETSSASLFCRARSGLVATPFARRTTTTTYGNQPRALRLPGHPQLPLGGVGYPRRFLRLLFVLQQVVDRDGGVVQRVQADHALESVDREQHCGAHRVPLFFEGNITKQLDASVRVCCFVQLGSVATDCPSTSSSGKLGWRGRQGRRRRPLIPLPSQ